MENNINTSSGFNHHLPFLPSMQQLNGEGWIFLQ